MGVQTLKHVPLLAAGLIGAVLLVQGTSSTPATASSSDGSVTVVAAAALPRDTPTVAATTAAAASLLSVPTKTVAVTTTASVDATTPAPTPTPTATATAQAATAVAGTASAPAQSTGVVTAAAATSAPAPIHTLISASTAGCAPAISGSTSGAPSAVSVNDIPGTTPADLQAFATEYNSIRVANCLNPIPFSNIRYSDCLQQRMFWIADDPSTNSASAWGHTGTAVRSDGLPIVGCDGDLAGGDGYTAATVADAWWASIDHRDSLYQPNFTGNVASVCIYFAMSHGGYNVPAPNEPYTFTRAAAYWAAC